MSGPATYYHTQKLALATAVNYVFRGADPSPDDAVQMLEHLRDNGFVLVVKSEIIDIDFTEEAERILWRMYEDPRPEEVKSAVKALQSAYDRGKFDAARSAWSPIGTAPKDGTPFWGKIDCDAKRMFWHEGFQEFISEFRRMEMAQGYTIDGAAFKDHSPVIHKPRWWMPMPESPTQECGQ